MKSLGWGGIAAFGSVDSMEIVLFGEIASPGSVIPRESHRVNEFMFIDAVRVPH